MKKTLILAMLALSLVACDQKNTDELKATEAQKQEEISENTQEDSEVVDDKDIENEEDEEENEINRTYPEDKPEKEVISVEKSKEKDEKDKKEDADNSEKNKKEKKKKSDKKSDKKSGKDFKKDENTDEKALTEDDLFFSYFNLVTVRGGEVCDRLTDIRDYGKDYFASYVPFSNNVFILGSYPDNDFSIRKINGEDLTLLYEFKINESFRPVGMEIGRASCRERV